MSDREKLGLALCPFCGGPARFGKCVPGEQELENDGAEYVECCDCGASTCLVFPCMDEAKPRLREMWNTRCRADPVAYLHTVRVVSADSSTSRFPLLSIRVVYGLVAVLVVMSCAPVGVLLDSFTSIHHSVLT